MKKIYISGKITGLPLEEAREQFAEASEIAVNKLHAYEESNEVLKRVEVKAVNPMELVLDPKNEVGFNPEKPWAAFMRADIRLLIECEYIYMIPGWGNSEGAILEHHLAQSLGLSILYGTIDPKTNREYHITVNPGSRIITHEKE